MLIVSKKISKNSLELVYTELILSIIIYKYLNIGERYYDRNTMRYLEKIQEKLNKEDINLKEIGKVLLYCA